MTNVTYEVYVQFGKRCHYQYTRNAVCFIDLLCLCFIRTYHDATITLDLVHNPVCGPPDPSFGIPGDDASYDYVVVGGGTAGLTIAARLAESGTYSVAVVEAGGFYEEADGNLSVIPSDDIWYAGSSPTDFNPSVDWGFVTTPQAVCSV